jgi:hypothetical protein
MVTFERGGEITIYALPRLDRVNSFSLGQVGFLIAEAHALMFPPGTLSLESTLTLRGTL